MTRSGETQSEETAARPQPGHWASLALVVGVATLLLLGLAMRRGINHDEHQFVAGAALVARNGLLPWYDFAWFHVPNQLYLSALLFRLTDRLLLAARLLQIAGAAGLLSLLATTALTGGRSPLRNRVATGSLVIVLLVTSAAFLHASGRAWNHDLGILLAIVATLVQVRLLVADSPLHPRLWSAGAGLMLGLAIGTRLTFAPLLLPFGVAPWLRPNDTRARLAQSVAFGVGVLLGLTPTLLTASLSPAAAWFGNFHYAQLNTAWYRAQVPAVDGLTLPSKLLDAARFLLQPTNLPLFLLTGAALWVARDGLRGPGMAGIRFWLLLMPFVLLGALAPTPMQMQYVYVLFPFVSLGLLLLLRQSPRPVLLPWMAVAALATTVLAAPRYAEGIAIVFTPDEWVPNKIHRRGQEMVTLAKSGLWSGDVPQIITLSPIDPLEGGARIDTRLVTGPFGWRVAPLLTESERVHFRLAGPDELAQSLAASPPRGIFTGLKDGDPRSEEQLVSWASAQGYTAVPMRDEGTLYLSPLATWRFGGATIRLGAHTLPERPLAPGAVFDFTLYLTSDGPNETNLSLLLRAENATGEELWRFDGWPYGSATSGWQPGVTWPSSHTVTLPAETAPGLIRLEATFYDPATLESAGEPVTFGWVQVAPETPPGPPLATFSGLLSLVDARAPTSARAGDTIAIDLLWMAVQPPTENMTAFLHLVSSDNLSAAPSAQVDSPPAAGNPPTSLWPAGLVQADTLRLTLPADLPPGDYTLLLGLYFTASQTRLEISPPTANQAIAVATVTVAP